MRLPTGLLLMLLLISGFAQAHDPRQQHHRNHHYSHNDSRLDHHRVRDDRYNHRRSNRIYSSLLEHSSFSIHRPGLSFSVSQVEFPNRSRLRYRNTHTHDRSCSHRRTRNHRYNHHNNRHYDNYHHERHNGYSRRHYKNRSI